MIDVRLHLPFPEGGFAMIDPGELQEVHPAGPGKSTVFVRGRGDPLVVNVEPREILMLCRRWLELGPIPISAPKDP